MTGWDIVTVLEAMEHDPVAIQEFVERSVCCVLGWLQQHDTTPVMPLGSWVAFQEIYGLKGMFSRVSRTTNILDAALGESSGRFRCQARDYLIAHELAGVRCELGDAIEVLLNQKEIADSRDWWREKLGISKPRVGRHYRQKLETP